MTYLPGRSAAAAMVAVSIGMRMFWGLAVDSPFAMNASWICPLFGFLVFMPLGFAINQAAKLGQGSIWDNLTNHSPAVIAHILELFLTLLLIYDGAVVVRMLASSSNLIALNDITVHILVFPLTLVVAAVIWLGGSAAGNSARIWLKILPLFAVIILAVQYKAFRPGWLTPAFGGGLNSIIDGSIYCAGCLALASLSWIVAVPDRNKHGIFPYTFFPCIAVALLMAAQHMSFPAMINIPFTRAARIELILSNGRMSLSPQLILDILWFGSLLHLISSEVSTAAAYLYSFSSKLPKWLLALTLSTIVTLLAIFNPIWLQDSAKQTKLLFSEIGGLFVGLLLLSKNGRGVKLHAQN